jgi:NTP pyrophosphatase (non-canonical NTP hydrolase)
MLKPDERARLDLATIWLAEEAGEAIKAYARGEVDDQLDALYDAMGIIVATLHGLDPSVRQQAFDAYVAAQVRRDRDVSTPHMIAIRMILRYLDTTESTKSLTVLENRGKRRVL